ncbi:DeoR/GlpR family DNA-binding transcription regulator [Aliiroseovarius sp. YM-037]|uniref:DeoR/GlpR family DNA-binding transcription regulator n=1 Tax=Aliiroseovarius sp. YM-037 TaxID=3341728 RepID=UPI003A8135F1
MISSKTTNQREQEILREIRLSGGSCRITYLAERLGVSNETVRRNIKSLEENAIVRKVHGGVHLRDDSHEPPLQNRMDTQAATKQRLAEAVAETISDGDSVFLDIGSTTAYVAIALKQHSDLYVVTNSVFVAQTLSTRNNNRVFLAGGELRPHDGGAFGAEALEFIGRFNVRFAVFSVGAVNAEQGFMLHDLEEANIAKVAAAGAQVRIVVADAEKFGKRAPVAMGASPSVDILFTDQQPTDDVAKLLRRSDTELVVLSPDSPS